MKCPKCESAITEVIAEDINASVGVMGRSQWRCIAYRCPRPACQTVLSVEMNPKTLQADLLAEVRKLLGRT